MSRKFAADMRESRSRQRHSKKRVVASIGSGARAEQKPGIFNLLRNPSTVLISALFMVIFVFHSEVVHSSRLLNEDLLRQQEREQRKMKMMQEELNNIVGSSSSNSLRYWEEVKLSTSKQELALLEVNDEGRNGFAGDTPNDRRDYPVQNSLIPEIFHNLGDLTEPYSKADIHIPFFWHIAKSGGTTIKHMYSDCYGLVEACESGIEEGHLDDQSLQIITLRHGWTFLNVDTTTPKGIERAAQFNIALSGKVDLISSPLPHTAASKLFIQGHKGRMFTVLRDPIQRAVSLFHYLQKAKHEPTYNPALQNMTLEEYAFSELVESNFITRTLLDKMEAPLEEIDFKIAQDILRSKVLVGLLDELQESVRRFELYFHFGDPAPNATCKEHYVRTGSNRQSVSQILSADAPAYVELQRKNHMDLRLYEYAVELFHIQGSMFEAAE